MFATTSLNGIIGHAALVVGLAASVFGALGLGIATATGDKRLLRSISNYAWMALAGAVIAVVVMERALITRDFKLAYIQQVGSRDTPVRRHVQDHLREAADTLRRWVDEGGVIYVCGSLAGMAPGVDRALRDVLGDARVDDLLAENRYRRDVY